MFTEIDAARIRTICDALKSEKWHFMKPSGRLAFLAESCPKKDSVSIIVFSPIFAWAVTVYWVTSYDRRDFIFDVLLEEAEFCLIGGGNG